MRRRQWLDRRRGKDYSRAALADSASREATFAHGDGGEAKHGMQGFQFFDLFIFAMIAAFLVLRLHRVLGRRTGHQPPPEQNRRDAGESGEVIPLPDRNAQREDMDEETAEEAGTPPPPPRRGPAGMTQVKIADPGFDEASFMDGARYAFETILEAYASGNKKSLKSLLALPVYEGFADEIDRREKANETLETSMVSFILADIVGAAMAGHKARLTVEFLTEQVNVLRDAEGDVIDGDAATVAKITDIWTFERDTRSRDPNWQLVDTDSED
ncbi:MAG: Tim44/TimA family putative adaptor protein [Alphaproteobacteria bacterium]|jgi:predicted lipid-binding transport protein (Tim44 family)|nr:Tim44/TimA family putative adaptor protein [Alphaproteobacteria bacterium]